MFLKLRQHILLLTLFSTLYHLNFTAQVGTNISEVCLYKYQDQCDTSHFPVPDLRPCFCQEDSCWLYNDCCKGVKPEPVYRIDIKPNCDSSLGYNVINQCPATWTDKNIQLLCGKDVDTENYSYILDLPFQSNKTNALYSNLYCAICNLDYSPVNQLEIEMTCAKDNCSSDIIDKFNYERGKLIWNHPESNNTARISFQGTALRRCVDVIEDCADDWSDVNISSQCHAYANYVWSGMNFRNTYCAICNHKNISNISCYTIKSRFDLGAPATRKIPTYIALIDFRNHKTDCNSNQILDGSNICIPFLCGKNYVPQNGYCVATDLSTNTTDNTSKITCPKTAISTDQLYILPNNSIFVNQTGEFYNTNEYEKINDTTYLLCLYPDYDSHLFLSVYPLAHSVINVVCMVLSLISLSIHIVVHFVIGNYKLIPGKNLLNLSFALLFAQLIYLFGNMIDFHKSICYIVAVLSHYLFLVVFFWMNVMAFDICIAITKSEHKSNSKKTFLYYLIYSWLLPLVIVILSICIDQTNILPDIKPYYGLKMCWISQKSAILVLFAIPLAILLIENIFFFLFTAISICKTRKLTQYMTKSNESERFTLYIKLAFIMGGTWILGFVVNLTDSEVLTYIYTVLNASQGTFVFIIFTLKRRIIKQFCDKLRANKKVSSIISPRTITTTKSSDSDEKVNTKL